MVIIQLDSEQLSTLIQDAVRKAIGETVKAQPSADTDELLSVQGAADFLRLAASTVYTMVQRQELPVCKRGGRLYFSKKELIEYVKGGRKKTMNELEAEASSYVGSRRRR